MLLMLRADTQTWGLPGGGMNVGESIEECALRECFEETGIQASITRLVGLYSNKNMLIDYGDQVAQIVAAHFSGTVIDGMLSKSTESIRCNWWSRDEAEQLQLFPFHRARIDDSWTAPGHSVYMRP
jgi:8-oxo-dGTP pyrophosphatase MutT (NUDIX family)